MSKWLSVRHIAIKEDEVEEIGADERVISAEFEAPYFYIVVVKESNRNPNKE